MDAKYIVPKLKVLCGLWYDGKAFAKYSERRSLYIFGSITDDKVHKNIITKAVAIYIVVGSEYIEKERNDRRRKG